MAITKTKVCKPNRRLGYYTLNYLEGIQLIWDMIEVALCYNIIKQSGAWYEILDKDGNTLEIDGKILKFQGKSKLINYLQDNNTILNKLMDRLDKEMV